MSKKRKLEKIRISNYETLCIIRDCTPEQKNVLIERVRESVALESLVIKSEVKNLAYPIEKIKTAEYLLLSFKIARERIGEIEETLKNPLVIRHMTVNLDTEKKIKIRNSDKLAGSKKLKKPWSRVEKSPQGNSSREAKQESADQLGVNN